MLIARAITEDAAMLRPLDTTQRSRPKIGPCPLHECALEIGLASLTVIAGLGLWLSPIEPALQHWFSEIPASARAFVQPCWGGLLIVAGIAQAASLRWRWSCYPPYIAAMVGTIAWLFVASFAFQAGLYLFLMTAVWATLAQGYIAGMLKP